MKTFLTGEVGVGKSTALRKYIQVSGAVVTGIMTVFGSADEAGEERLYVVPWSDDTGMAVAGALSLGLPHAGSRNKKEHVHSKFPEVFNDIGVRLLSSARETIERGSADIIVIDELGFLEAEAHVFQSEVISLIDDPEINIIGIVKEKSSEFTDAVKRHELVTLLTVTPENRDTIPSEMLFR